MSLLLFLFKFLIIIVLLLSTLLLFLLLFPSLGPIVFAVANNIIFVVDIMIFPTVFFSNYYSFYLCCN